MSASDCFEIGKAAYLNYHYNHSVSWLQKSLELFDKSQVKETTFERANILEYLIYSYIRLRDNKNAAKVSQEIAKILSIEKLTEIDKFHQELFKKRKPNYDEEISGEDLVLQEIYEAGCRGEIELPANVAKSLECRYTHNNKDFYKVAPLKLEELYKPHPYIVIYHQVMSDDEIELVKELGKPTVSL